MPRETETPDWCLGVLHQYWPSFPHFLLVSVWSPVATGVHSCCFMGPDRHQALNLPTGVPVLPPLFSHHFWAHLASRGMCVAQKPWKSFQTVRRQEGPGQPSGRVLVWHRLTFCVHWRRGGIAGCQKAKTWELWWTWTSTKRTDPSP